MAGANALLIVLQHAPDFFEPIEKCVLACVCTEAAHYVRFSWASGALPLAFTEPVGTKGIAKCMYCASERAKDKRPLKPVQAWNRCAACVGTLSLVSATVAIATYYVKDEHLERLESVSRKHARYPTMCTYYQRRDVINAALCVWSGPGPLKARINKKHAPSKVGEERNAKLAVLLGADWAQAKAHMQANGSWDLCVAGYLANGKGGVREVKARLKRFAEWPFHNVEYAHKYLAGFVVGTHGLQRVQLVVDRHTALTHALAIAGLTWRSDSRMCSAYVHEGREFLETVVETMKEMDWLYAHTDYELRMREECKYLSSDIREEYGWLSEEEYREVYQVEKDAISLRIRADIKMELLRT